jgi:hypothetical protein
MDVGTSLIVTLHSSLVIVRYERCVSSGNYSLYGMKGLLLEF